ncbi:hypothetical protein PG989_000481 [Apiospora arundinis]
MELIQNMSWTEPFAFCSSIADLNGPDLPEISNEQACATTTQYTAPFIPLAAPNNHYALPEVEMRPGKRGMGHIKTVPSNKIAPNRKPVFEQLLCVQMAPADVSMKPALDRLQDLEKQLQYATQEQSKLAQAALRQWEQAGRL